jgi:hypothetical protein
MKSRRGDMTSAVLDAQVLGMACNTGANALYSIAAVPMVMQVPFPSPDQV